MVVLIVFLMVLIALGILYRKDTHSTRKKVYAILIRLCLTLAIVVAFLLSMLFVGLDMYNYHGVVRAICAVVPLTFLLPIWFQKKRKTMAIVTATWCLLAFCGYVGNLFYLKYDKSLIVNTDVNINVGEYMPFDSQSKIVKLSKQASLKLTENLPIVDGAAAVFPVYSAFVNAVYPNTVTYQEEPFLYNNTGRGYDLLASKKTDIFFGAYPSKEQIEYAKKQGTEFEYTEIGKEGFVFFVNKKNPVDSLTVQQIKDIYSGKITNWKEVGGRDEEIKAFQRNKGSGSQSMLIRFMGDTPIMDPPTDQVMDLMSGIINQVANYKNYSNSIGFSFRYYLETLIANPNVKMLKINGIAPTKENISNGTYPIVGSLYAVTYQGNPNENVQKLINWILSEEGQEIIEKTGYARCR